MVELTNIYGLVDPRTNLISYIGKTNLSLEKRLKTHLYDAIYSKRKRENNKRINWILKLNSINKLPTIELIDSVPLCDWEFWEKHYIKLYKSAGALLYNGDDGGINRVTGRKKILNRKQSFHVAEKSRANLMSEKCIENRKKSYALRKGVPVSEKTLLAIRTAAIKKRTGKICQYDLNGKFVKEWDTLLDIKIENAKSNFISNITRSYITQYRTAFGFHWRKGSKDEIGEAIKIEKKKHYLSKKVFQFKGDLLINEYESISQASKVCNIHNESIRLCSLGKRKTAGGFIWKVNKEK